MPICECMFKHNESGDSVCNRCRGDIYACECPMIHSPKCADALQLKQDAWDEAW